MKATTFEPADRERWHDLWGAYLTFYETALAAATYDSTWSRLLSARDGLHGLGVRDADGTLIGIAHYLFHVSAWTPNEVCYLQDLFVDPAHRGRGHARTLIEAVSRIARERSCQRLYWMTQPANVTARRLYDSLARASGFIEYERILTRPTGA